MPTGRYPLAVLNIAMPPEEVDVNIHPTKREVRFRREREVFSAVQKAVRTLLMAQHPIPVATPPFAEGTAWQQRQQELQSLHRLSAEQARRRWSCIAPAGCATDQPTPTVRPLWSRRQRPRTTAYCACWGRSPDVHLVEGTGWKVAIDQQPPRSNRYEELTLSAPEWAWRRKTASDPLPIELSPQQATLLEESSRSVGRLRVRSFLWRRYLSS
jgi:hypothetical protein